MIPSPTRDRYGTVLIPSVWSTLAWRVLDRHLLDGERLLAAEALAELVRDESEKRR